MRIHFRIRIAFAKFLEVIASHQSIAFLHSHRKFAFLHLRIAIVCQILRYIELQNNLIEITLVLFSSNEQYFNHRSRISWKFRNFANWELRNCFNAMYIGKNVKKSDEMRKCECDAKM